MRSALALAVLAAWGTGASAAGALEAWDGKLELHGFYELQARAIARDLDGADDFDLTQLAHVLNLELEARLAPTGFGPFDTVEAFLRVEVRYDCVWTRACGAFPSVDAFGDGVKKLPRRLLDGRRSGRIGNVLSFDMRPFRGGDPQLQGLRGRGLASDGRDPLAIDETSSYFPLFIAPGPDQIFGSADDPGAFVFSRYRGGRCKFGARKLSGPEFGIQTLDLGPLDPGCFVQPIAAFAERPNPLRGELDFFGRLYAPSAGLPIRVERPRPRGPPDFAEFTGGDLNPTLVPAFLAGDLDRPVGTGDLPLRPAPALPFDAVAAGWEPRGLWLPHPDLARALRSGELDRFGGNFRQDELAWNHGASQQDERELKEAYLDLELFDSRLWLRLGKQSIVWGKTELFRNQDRINPQDFALSSLPTLEESRIALWALRGVWSFYDVGELQDVRLELALNVDQFEPADLGRCGEPYAVALVCSAYFGFLAHGITGIGLAGTASPDAPWEDVRGLEAGARVEWRWDRFSFAASAWRGYRDLPWLDRLVSYARNVDPASGRPRVAGSSGRCRGNVFGGRTRPAPDPAADPRNLVPDPVQVANGIPAAGPAAQADCLTPERALRENPANQTVFAVSCASLIGLIDLDPASCGNQLFNSKANFFSRAAADDFARDPTFAALLANLWAGNGAAWSVASQAAGAPTFFEAGGPIFVTLNRDPCDGFLSFQSDFGGTPGCDGVGGGIRASAEGGINQPNAFFGADPDGPDPVTGDLVPDGPSLNFVLTQEQKALLGCGEFYGSNCEIDGVDLFNMEASAVAQSFVGIEGTSGDWDATDPSLPQPGTLAAPAIPVCTRFENGTLEVIAGCRADDHPDHDPRIDGTATGLVHPFTGQPFRSELAALSWNVQMVLAALSLPPDSMPFDRLVDRAPEVDEFDVTQPFRSDGCSYARPQFCKNFENFARALRVQRNVVRAGGNGRFGRRDFQWHEGGAVAIRWEKTTVLGFASDWAEDWSKSSWNLELTWEDDVRVSDARREDGIAEVDFYNLTVSVDRPTFVNFLNPNRTFFLNSQWFVQYVGGHRRTFPSNGPWNLLATLTVATGYFQDRLLTSMTLVYDVRSNSGAFLPQSTYRFNERFSATIGLALFAGSVQSKPMALNPIASGNRVGPQAYRDYVENGLSAVRERDEIFLRLKATF